LKNDGVNKKLVPLFLLGLLNETAFAIKQNSFHLKNTFKREKRIRSEERKK